MQLVDVMLSSIAFSDKAGGGEGGKDPCHPNPCLNGGTCKQNGNGFDCLCEVQYTGSVCEGMSSSHFHIRAC